MRMDQKPNVLILFSDQLRPFELGCYGHPIVRTPNMDRLASMGVRFEYAVTPNPVCTPARAATLSGQYSRTCQGMLGCCANPQDIRTQFPDTTLAELLQIGGQYDSAYVGKWHIKPKPHLLGFKEPLFPWFFFLNSKAVYTDGKGAMHDVHGFCPDWEIDRSREFLRQKRDKPFFLFHSMNLPHMSYYDVPEKYLSMYNPKDTILRTNVYQDGKMWHDEQALKVYLYDYLVTKFDLPLELPKGYDLTRLTAHYYGLVTSVDDQIGRLLQTLEETDQLENTIIMLISDHGENLGSQHLWNKVSVNDEALRIPFVIVWPEKIKPSRIAHQVASLVDVAPTILSLTGNPVPAHMQGADLSPLLFGSPETVRNGAAFAENLMGEITIRTPTHMYSVLTEVGENPPERRMVDDRFMFYDTQSDPYQQENLAKTDRQQDKAADLRYRLLEWNRKTPWMPGSLGGTYGDGHDIEGKWSH